MVLECLECNYKCGTLFNLVFHYKTEHKDKISGCACGDESLSGICIKELASSSSFKSSSISNSNSNSNYNSISNSNCNSNSKSNSNSNSNSISNSNSSPKPNSKPNSTYANINFDITSKVCNKCKVIKQITSFDKKKSICKEFNSKMVSC